MKYLLGLLAIVTGLYVLLFGIELMTVDARPNATVNQQMSARLGVGLSMVAFILSAGLAAICHGIDCLRADLSKRPVVAASPTHYAPSQAPIDGAGGFNGKTTEEIRRERAASSSAQIEPSSSATSTVSAGRGRYSHRQLRRSR